MQFVATRLRLPDVMIVTPRRFADARGYFMETYQRDRFRELGIAADFVQDNEAASARAGTIRGLHFQKPPHAQGKLVRVVKGAIFDVAVDIRAGSPTYGQWAGATLTAATGEQIWVPRGFAHGYCTLEDDTVVAYKCDNPYAPEVEGGIHFADPALALEWPVARDAATVSGKDDALPPLDAIGTPFPASIPMSAS
jgi:dTDP-4-dehydrorhamnose 3,5-epimerase